MNYKEITSEMLKDKQVELNELCLKYLNDEVTIMELPNSRDLGLYCGNLYIKVVEKFLENLVIDFKEENRIKANYVMHFVLNDKPYKKNYIPYALISKLINKLHNETRQLLTSEIDLNAMVLIAKRLYYYHEIFYSSEIGTKVTNCKGGLEFVLTEEIAIAATKLIEIREEFYCYYTMDTYIRAIVQGKYNIDEINELWESRLEQSKNLVKM